MVPSFHYEDNALLVGKSETSFQRSYGSVIIPPSAEIVGVYVFVCMLVTQLCLILCDSMDYIALQAPLPLELSSQEYWSGLSLPFPS